MRAPEPTTPARGAFAGIGRNVVALGLVSFFTDVSSEMIVPVLPLFVTGVLGASVTSLGVIEGIAEATASLLRIGSGWLSDRVGRRKPFLVVGYGISGAAKAALALAASWPAVLALRFSDRVGKGLRNPPRDALIADSTTPAMRGRAFGLHRGMDTLGAAIGPLVAWVLIQRAGAAGPDFRGVFALSAIPAVLSVLVLLAFVRAPRRERATPSAESRAPFAAPPALRRFLLADGVFQLGNSSMAFALLRAQHLGLSAAQVTLVYFGYNMVYALLSYPLGGWSDRIGRRPLLLAAYGVYAVVYGVLALATHAAHAVAAFALLGLHSALLEGQQKSLVADLVHRDQRGTAYGLYHTVVGAALLPASVLAGALWDRMGAPATFGAGAALALIAAALFAALLPNHREHGDRHAHAG